MSVGLVLLAFGVLLLPPRRTWPVGVGGGGGGGDGGAGTGGGPGRLDRRWRRTGVERSLPAVLDLVAVALRSGAAPGPALVAAAVAADPPLRARLTAIGGQLALGVDPARAWASAQASPSLAAVAVLAERSGTSGARLADTFAAIAATLRDDAVADGRRAAARVGVWSVLPLGLCFLPAFVCLGVVPAVVGLLGGLDTPLP